MSTQHPDNVTVPFFAEREELEGEDEIREAYYAFSRLGCDEQLWDCEGKEVDNFLVKKLLTTYGSFFRERRVGRDIFITLRVPNPLVEVAEAKLLIESLASIPRSFDTAYQVFKDGIAPIFEVIVPMTISSTCISRVYNYYAKFFVENSNRLLATGDITIAKWVGSFRPETIHVIPLFEDQERLLTADQILKDYFRDKQIEYQRVFLARSDPAMNYGMISAMLLNKVALQRLWRITSETGIPIYPILGLGGSPFRGNLTPKTAQRIAEEYPSVSTFTIQSAFKYDYDPDEVIEALKKLQNRTVGPPLPIDETRSMEIVKKYSAEYTRQVTILAPLINRMARYIPSRRKRKPHTGLFGYSRKLDGAHLPRAIAFTASLYSLGLPPEILALNALDHNDIQYIKEICPHFENDMKDAVQYWSPRPEITIDGFDPHSALDRLGIKYTPHVGHAEITNYIVDSFFKQNDATLESYVLRTAHLRKFLG